MTFGELAQKMSLLSCPLLIKVIQQIKDGTLHPVPQDPSKVTFAAKITPAETEIKWNRSAAEIHNLIRGISPQPGAWCWVQIGADKKRLKIKRSEVATGLVSDQAYFGENIVFSDKEWIIACGTGALKLLEVQLEGKKSLPIGEFLRGFHEPCKILS
jgi:methionyl-tRNA formyltransferase